MVFLLVVLLVYAGLNLNFILRLNAAISLGRIGWIGWIGWAVIVAVSPLLFRFLDSEMWSGLRYVIAFAGYTWLVFLFLFLAFSLPLDLYRLVRQVGRLLPGGRPLPGPGAIAMVGIPALIAVFIFAWGLVEARHLRVERLSVSTPRLSAGGRIRIVQISDVHLGLMGGESRLQRILATVKAASPDILVSTGDLVDGQLDHIEPLAEQLAAVPAPGGKFAVTGNHEHYAGLERALAFTRQAGFTVLRGEATSVGDHLSIVGVDDPAIREGHPTAAGVLDRVVTGNFVLLLRHRPGIEAGTAGRFDLQLSGHTHKGQVFPFSLITGLTFGHQAGFRRVSERSAVYISRGTGTWGPPIRFLAPPELTIIDLVPEPDDIRSSEGGSPD